MMPHTVWTDTPTSRAQVYVAQLVDVAPDGRVTVSTVGMPARAARFLDSVTQEDMERAFSDNAPVLVLQENVESNAPIVIGIVRDTPRAVPTPSEDPAATVDGQTIDITGKERVTLRCGKASVTLTKAGKIILRGAYLSSRSSGVNRIKGGSVQIN